MRNFIKCAFSLVEGSCFGLRSFCADANNLPGIDHLDSDELDYILEKQKWIKRDDVVKDSFKFFARVMNFHFILDCDKPGWPALTRSWLVRDRLAHPKKVEDLAVDEREVADTHEGLQWFIGEADRLVKSPPKPFAA